MIRARLLLKHERAHAGEDASRALADCGFGILQQSEATIGFEGTVELFERVFKVRVDTDGEHVRVRGEPMLPEALANAAEAVYVPTPPTYF